MKFNVRPIDRLLRMVCVLSLLVVSIVHHPAALAQYAYAQSVPNGSVDLGDYVAPDGSIPVLCFAGGDTQDPVNLNKGQCDFCRNVSVAALPAPSGLFETCTIATVTRLAFVAKDEAIRPIDHTTASPRGPPPENQTL